MRPCAREALQGGRAQGGCNSRRSRAWEDDISSDRLKQRHCQNRARSQEPVACHWNSKYEYCAEYLGKEYGEEEYGTPSCRNRKIEQTDRVERPTRNARRKSATEACRPSGRDS